MLNLTRNYLRICRKISTTPAVLQKPRSLAQFKKYQADFQCEDGRPIYLKWGICDRLLYSSTVLLCFFGVFMNLLTIYDHAKPSSWKEQTC